MQSLSLENAQVQNINTLSSGQLCHLNQLCSIGVWNSLYSLNFGGGEQMLVF